MQHLRVYIGSALAAYDVSMNSPQNIDNVLAFEKTHDDLAYLRSDTDGITTSDAAANAELDQLSKTYYDTVTITWLESITNRKEVELRVRCRKGTLLEKNLQASTTKAQRKYDKSLSTTVRRTRFYV
jgi:hypothetical protein